MSSPGQLARRAPGRAYQGDPPESAACRMSRRSKLKYHPTVTVRGGIDAPHSELPHRRRAVPYQRDSYRPTDDRSTALSFCRETTLASER